LAGTKIPANIENLSQLPVETFYWSPQQRHGPSVARHQVINVPVPASGDDCPGLLSWSTPALSTL